MRVVRWLVLVLVVFALGAAPIVYFIGHWQVPGFLDNTMGNWFATLMGVVLGVPIALWVTSWQQRLQERAVKAERQHEQQERQTAILKLVYQELTHNRNQAKQGLDTARQNKLPISTLGLKQELWQALSQGGELHWISDLDLLNTLADAYYNIRLLDMYQIRRMNGMNSIGSETWITRWVIEQYPPTLSSCNTALTAIDNHLAALG